MTEHKYTDEEIIKAFDILNKFEFFGGQRAGRELWFNKPTDIQNKDIGDFLRDLDFLKQFISRQNAEISALTSAVDNSTQEFLKLHDKYQDQRAEVAFWMDAAANAKKEAVKEFAEKLKKECLFDRGYEILQDGTIDHLVKEFTEEKT